MKELSKARMLDILKTRETCAFCPHVLEAGSCLSCDRVAAIAFDELRRYYRQLEEILQRQEEEPEQLRFGWEGLVGCTGTHCRTI